MERSTFVKSFTRKIARTRQRRKTPQNILKSLAHACFPITFFLRNVLTLTAEAHWNMVSPRLKRMKIRNMLEERSRFFLEVVQWLELHGEVKMDSLPEGCGAKNVKAVEPREDSYCTHCGGCCEIASGLADFPSESIIPSRWQHIFGEGLGRGHRFCPFLWEERVSRGSLCAIHPWRSHPCRTFELEECRFLLNDPGFRKLSDPAALTKTYRLMLRLIDAR